MSGPKNAQKGLHKVNSNFYIAAILSSFSVYTGGGGGGRLGQNIICLAPVQLCMMSVLYSAYSAIAKNFVLRQEFSMH